MSTDIQGHDALQHHHHHNDFCRQMGNDASLFEAKLVVDVLRSHRERQLTQFPLITPSSGEEKEKKITLVSVNRHFVSMGKGKPEGKVRSHTASASWSLQRQRLPAEPRRFIVTWPGTAPTRQPPPWLGQPDTHLPARALQSHRHRAHAVYTSRLKTHCPYTLPLGTGSVVISHSQLAIRDRL